MKYLHTLICNMYFLHSCWSQSWVIIPQTILEFWGNPSLIKIILGGFGLLIFSVFFCFDILTSYRKISLFCITRATAELKCEKTSFTYLLQKNLGNQACILKLMDVDEIIKCFLWENLQVDLRVKLLTKNK